MQGLEHGRFAVKGRMYKYAQATIPYVPEFLQVYSDYVAYCKTIDETGTFILRHDEPVLITNEGMEVKFTDYLDWRWGK